MANIFNQLKQPNKQTTSVSRIKQIPYSLEISYVSIKIHQEPKAPDVLNNQAALGSLEIDT